MINVSELKQRANQVLAATRESENTAARVGSALLELAKYVEALPFAQRISFQARRSGVALVIHSNTEGGRTAETSVEIPIFTQDAAGLFTPALMAELRQTIEDGDRDLAETCEQLRREIDTLRDFVKESNAKEAQRFEEERRAIEQLLESRPEGRGVYVLKNILSPQSLELLRSRFPHLTIKNPSWTGFSFHQDLPVGCFTQNLENHTGFGTGRPLEPSGHLAAIIDKYDRVQVKRKNGEVVFTKMQKNDHTLYPDGTSIQNVDDGDNFLRIPRFWYKGVSDYFSGVNYFFVASERPDPAKGVRIKEEGLQCFESKAIGLSDTSHRLEEALVDNSLTTVWRVSVSGYRFVTFPSSAFNEGQGKIYGTMFFDRRGIRCGHTVAPIGPKGEDVGYMDGMRFCAEIPEGAVDMYFTLPTAIRPEWVWLTKSEEIYDRNPDVHEFAERLVSVYAMRDINGTPRSSVKGGGQWISTTIDQVHEQIRTHYGQGWNVFSYDSYNMLANLHYAISGERHTGSNWEGGDQTERSLRLAPTTSLHANNFLRYIDGVQTYIPFFMGMVNIGAGFLDGISADRGDTITSLRIDDREVMMANHLHYNNVKRVLFGSYCDNIAMTGGGSISTYAGSMAFSATSSVAMVYSYHWIYGCMGFGFGDTGNRRKYHIEYIGAMRELTTEEFKQL